MLTKFGFIKNFAVFKDFDWNTEVKDTAGTIKNFEKVNIIFGRNYSGKTSLSRILRSCETKSLSDKYINPEFSLEFRDGSVVDHTTYRNYNQKNIRVFNEDFIKENLSFFSNPSENINSFAVLGPENNEIEKEIKKLEKELGSNEEGSESELYLSLLKKKEDHSKIKNDISTLEGELDKKLSTKATDRNVGIKYNSKRFGDQNYTKLKLVSDIISVLMPSFEPKTEKELTELDSLLNENVNREIPEGALPPLNIDALNKEAKSLIEKEIGKSDKIEKLIKDAILNKWVKEGKELHTSTDNCAFCGNTITESRWDALDRHFDEESQLLERKLSDLSDEITVEKIAIEESFKIDKDLFYQKYHSSIERLSIVYDHFKESYIRELDELLNQINDRKNDILNSGIFSEVNDFKKRLQWIVDIYNTLRLESNNYASTLNSDQEKAKEILRLNEVYKFQTTIDYQSAKNKIDNLKKNETEEWQKVLSVQKQIDQILEDINQKRKNLKDESIGAEKVNEFLNNFFGNNFFKLQAIPVDNEENKYYHFEVQREGTKAYHLSEGETSLIAFCYFMAKLQDIETANSKPIIWIDDPISSLDSNHIFFVYSLLYSELINKDNYEQLFISTHNLDFLKYLKRISVSSKTNFLINRIDKVSTIKLMPKYLKDYITEFNYLFLQIYKCSKIEEITEDNYTDFYNFGNNARKFLEIYLFYKYPNHSETPKEKMERFFGEGEVPAIIIDRLNNEYSHLSSAVERGQIPLEVPEMKKSAEKIIQRIKEVDPDQFEAFKKSID